MYHLHSNSAHEEIALMDFLAEQIQDMPESTVEIKEVVNIKSCPISD